MAKANDAQNPSMEQILQTIRGVISGEDSTAGQEADNDDVLELTEMVGDDGAITSLKKESLPESTNSNATIAPVEANVAADVLANIDNALKDDSSSEATTPSANTDTSPIVEDTEHAIAAAPVDNTPEASTQAEPELQEDAITANENIAEHPSTDHAPQAAEVAESESSQDTTKQDSPASPLEDEHNHESHKKSHLISEQAAAASTRALATLLHNLPKPKVDTPAFQSGLTLEELVVEALKPELSAWLDKNLPTLVTHIVEKEIKKLLPQPEE